MLDSIHGPRDLRRLDRAQLAVLAEEIRDFLVTSVSRTGGHLGPNLGVVELTLALHRVFDSPRDRILWDTGHQAYVHKIVTGRAGRLRRAAAAGAACPATRAGPSPSTTSIENSHASTALSYADGLAKAYQLRGETDRHVVAVIGDGALTGGMAWEALNNIAADQDRAGWSSSSTTTSGPTRRPSAGWPTTSPRCAPPAATSGSSSGASRCSAARRSSAPRSTTRCTA